MCASVVIPSIFLYIILLRLFIYPSFTLIVAGKKYPKKRLSIYRSPGKCIIMSAVGCDHRVTSSSQLRNEFFSRELSPTSYLERSLESGHSMYSEQWISTRNLPIFVNKSITRLIWTEKNKFDGGKKLMVHMQLISALFVASWWS